MSVEKPVQLKLNELPFAPGNVIVDAVTQGARGANRYPEFDSITLRQALAQKYGVDASWVAVGNGSVGVIQQIMIASGIGEVAFGWPSFEAFPQLAKAMRMPILEIDLKDGACDLQKTLAAVTPQTTAFIACTPNTPTGGILYHDDMEQFMQQVPAHVIVILDEAYGEFVHDQRAVRALELVRNYPNAIMTRTFSKAYGLAGLRVGYAIGQPELIAKVRLAGLPFTIPVPAQEAVMAALEDDTALLQHVQLMISERGRMAAALRAMDALVEEGHGNFLWLPLGERAQSAADKLATQDVLVKAAMPYGMRITIGQPDENDRLLQAWSNLRPLSV